MPGAVGPVSTPIASPPTALVSARVGRPRKISDQKMEPSAQPAARPRHAEALGAQFTQPPAGDARDVARMLVLVAVGISIMLLAAAATPDGLVRDSALGAVLMRRRIEVALAGAATLLVAVVGYLVSTR